jgi:hypothetical protein
MVEMNQHPINKCIQFASKLVELYVDLGKHIGTGLTPEEVDHLLVLELFGKRIQQRTRKAWKEFYGVETRRSRNEPRPSTLFQNLTDADDRR